MNPTKTPRSNWIITGSIISAIGLFLPLFTFASLNFAFSDSVWQLFQSPGGSFLWTLVLCPVALFVGALLIRSDKGGVGKFLITGAHLTQAVGLLWTIFKSIESGAFANSIANSYQQTTGIPDFFPEASLREGFWVILLGFAIAAVGLYFPKKVSNSEEN